MTHTPRTKTFLITVIRNFLAFRTAEDFMLTTDIKYIYRSDIPLGCLVTFNDPSTGRIHYYEVTVKEKL